MVQNLRLPTIPDLLSPGTEGRALYLVGVITESTVLLEFESSGTGIVSVVYTVNAVYISIAIVGGFQSCMFVAAASSPSTG